MGDQKLAGGGAEKKCTIVTNPNETEECLPRPSFDEKLRLRSVDKHFDEKKEKKSKGRNRSLT